MAVSMWVRYPDFVAFTSHIYSGKGAVSQAVIDDADIAALLYEQFPEFGKPLAHF
ncbi:MAG: hypothetical protein V8Q36_09160 [Anaerotignum sp.]